MAENEVVGGEFARVKLDVVDEEGPGRCDVLEAGARVLHAELHLVLAEDQTRADVGRLELVDFGVCGQLLVFASAQRCLIAFKKVN